MKLKNLFTCTVTGLLLCTSCIKDEAPNAEADILNYHKYSTHFLSLMLSV